MKELLQRPEVFERVVVTGMDLLLGIFLFFLYFKNKNSPNRTRKLMMGFVFGGLAVRFLYGLPIFAQSVQSSSGQAFIYWNFLTIGLFICGFYFFRSHRTSFLKASLTVATLISGISRFCIGYNYDFGPSLFTYLSDFLIFGLLFLSLGKIFFSYRSKLEQFVLGLAIAALTMTFITVTNLNSILPLPPLYVHPILCVAFIFWLWTKKSDFLFIEPKFSDSLIVASIGCYFLPVLPSLFVAAPPDADITTITELLGYHMQGVSLLAAPSGVLGEVLHVRYPAGLSSLGYFISWILNLRAAESLLLLWLGAYTLMIFSVMKLCKLLKIDSFLSVTYCISFTILGWQGFGGGHVQEQLSYSLGFFALYFLLSEQITSATLAICAAALIQPTAILPFFISYCFVGLQRQTGPSRLPLKKLFPSVLLFLTVLTYYLLINHHSTLQSQPGQLLSELTPGLFVKNIIRWFSYDTSKLFPLLVFIPLIFWKDKKFSAEIRWALLGWLVGVLFLDGMFGDTHWSGRFYKGFSVIGIFALTPALILHYLRENWNFDQNRLTLVKFIFLFIWLIQIAPLIPVQPLEPLFSRDDMRLGREITKFVGPHELIMNTGGYSAWTARGLSARNTVIERLGDHQLTQMTFKDRTPFKNCVTGSIESMRNCLEPLGVDYIWFHSQGMRQERINQIGKPDLQVGLSALYRIKPVK